jgi:transcription antitermination protein NusB
MHSELFHKTLQKNKVTWQADDDMLRRMYQDLKNQEVFREYLLRNEENQALDAEILIFILKNYTANMGNLQQHLEEFYANWPDDKKIAMQMAVRSIQVLASGDENGFILPISQNPEENAEYARNLLDMTIKQNDTIEPIIKTKIDKWEPHHIAVIDLIILKMAVAEFLYFPTIPVTVTINEYVELAKIYSTPQSKKFVNGVLDAIQKELVANGNMHKN